MGLVWLSSKRWETRKLQDDKDNRRAEAAKRALVEAAERRKRAEADNSADGETEIGGRDGPDPVRFGDWEKGGIASDF